MLKYHIINLASCRLCPRRAAGGKERRYMDQNDKNKSNKNNDRRRGVLSLLIWALVLTIGFNYLLSAMDTRKLAEGTCEIRYDEFLDLVRDGKVKEVEIADRTLNITPVDGFTYTDADGKTYSFVAVPGTEIKGYVGAALMLVSLLIMELDVPALLKKDEKAP